MNLDIGLQLPIFSGMTGAVSYTHLDVYKRQVCMFTGIQIHAEDTVETAVENTGFQGKLMVAIVDTEARDMPKVEGAVTVEIPKGTPLLTVGEENNWYEFYYQGKVAYVAKGDVEDANIDMAALDDEMKKNIEEDLSLIHI